VAIQTVTAEYELGFLPLQAEQYDFVVSAARMDRAPVQRFLELLRLPSTRTALRERGFELSDD
jgi:putative molybdopterin biosynthesis protein